MTISNTARQETYTGTGANTALNTVFVFEDDTDIVVTRRVTADGSETTMVLNTDYTVTGGSGSTGTVTPVDGATDFPTTVTWTIARVSPLTQLLNYVASGPFDAASHEDALDKLTRLVQEAYEDNVRSLRAPIADDGVDMVLPSKQDRLGKLLSFDATTGLPETQAVGTGTFIFGIIGEEIAKDDTAAEVMTELGFTADAQTMVLGATSDGSDLVTAANFAAMLTLLGFSSDAATLITKTNANMRVQLDAIEDVFTTQGDMLWYNSSAAARIAVGNDGEVLTLIAGVPTWNTAAIARGTINGLETTRDSTVAATISVGQARDSSDTVAIDLTSAMQKRLDQTWSAASGNGGLNATDFLAGTNGPEADTWYHFFVIQHTDGTVDAGFDKDIDCTNLLADSGYTYYRRVASILTNGSEEIIDYSQDGDEFTWASPVQDSTSAPNSTSRATYTLSVPPDVTNRAIVNVTGEFSVTDRGLEMSSLDTTDAAVNFTGGRANLWAHGTAGLKAAGRFIIRTNTSKQIGGRDNDGAMTSFSLTTVGWIDERGKGFSA